MRDRIKPLTGVKNFRDFGGYATESGMIKPGLLYRSGHYHQASDEDVTYLNGLGVSFHIDLRRPDERTRQPNKWLADGARLLASDGGSFEKPAHEAAADGGDLTPESVADFMRGYYRDAPFQDFHIELFKGWFDHIDQTTGASVIHCAAGKDRTGIICALTHIVLGVSEDDVMTDYEMTNIAVDLDAEMPKLTQWFNKMNGREYSEDVVRPFMGVDKSYLENAFDAMSTAHGSPRAYMREVLGVDQAREDALKRHFIQA